VALKVFLRCDSQPPPMEESQEKEKEKPPLSLKGQTHRNTRPFHNK